MENLDFIKRVADAKEMGFLDGVNGLKMKDTDKLPMLIHEGLYSSCDYYLSMLYMKEYYLGEDERVILDGGKIYKINPHKAAIYSAFRYASKAFELGRESVDDDVIDYITNEGLNNMQKETDSADERTMLYYFYEAGHLYAKEENKNKAEERSKLSYKRMCALRDAYECGEEPELRTAFNRAYHAYSHCVDLLDLQGLSSLRTCLTCPGIFRIVGCKPESLGSEEFNVNCLEDCAEADNIISDICDDYLGYLLDYYVVKDGETE